MGLAVEIADLHAGYGGTPIIRGLSLRVPEGGRLGIAGESGCGKSTLLKVLAGLHPFKGTGRVSTPVGYVPQEGLASLSPFLTVGAQVTEFTRSTEETTRLFACAGMNGERWRRAYPHQLSGGERQRVLTIQALALRPRVIVADEPTANLDPENEELVLRLIEESGAAIVIASHRERVFQRLGCSEILWMTPAPVRGCGVAGLVCGETVVSLRGASKTHFRRDWLRRPRAVVKAVDDVSFEIRASEAVALVGPSGAGKSTLARCLAGRETFDSGELSLVGGCRLVQQEPSESLNPRFTISEALREARAQEATLEDVNLPAEWIDRSVSALSEGQRARVAILRSAAGMRQGLLILDESLSGLDVATRSSILSYLRRRQREAGLAVLLVTHDLEAAAELGARVVRMEAGRVQ